MSSASTAAAAADAVTVADPAAEKAPRRFPPPCWTQEETLVLIEAYRERWYALRRGYLRTADWDAVADAVASGCPGASPAKTSAQCRHKMEKLRQRYRAEKQRALSFPHPGGRFFSSWFFFENMEAMENGTTAPTYAEKIESSADGSRLKSLLDQNTLKLKLKAKSNGDDNSVKSNRSDKEEEDDEDLVNFERRQQFMNGITLKPPQKPKRSGKKLINSFDDVGERYHHQDILPPQIRKFQKLEQPLPNAMIYDNNNNTTSNSQEGFWVKIHNNHNFNNSSTNFNNSSTNSRAPPFVARPRASSTPDSDARGASNGTKRGRNALDDIVGSIKMLGEGFVKMERAKMEMAREMEAMRMEVEMKRNQMLLESQKQIVDAFMKGLFEMKKKKKNKKVKTADSAES